jgi:hypothetical protein
MPASRAVPFRLQATSRRLLCLIGLPDDPAAGGFARELVLVASPRPPRLRRLIVHRRLAGPAPCPDDTPEAA